MDEPELFIDIKTYLRLEKYMSEQQRDLYLSQFNLGFRGASDNWSVPESYYKEALALERQEKQAKAYRYQWGGTMATDENGGVTIRYGQAHMVIPAESWSQFLQDAFSQHPGPHAGGPLGTGVASPGHSSAPVNVGNNHLEADDRPLLKERMERSLKELEKIGQQSNTKSLIEPSIMW
jgi:hypothetical protein